MGHEIVRVFYWFKQFAKGRQQAKEHSIPNKPCNPYPAYKLWVKKSRKKNYYLLKDAEFEDKEDHLDARGDATGER